MGGSSNNNDHTLVNGTVTILAGQTTTTIELPVVDDGLIEGTESVSVTLTSITSGDPQISIGSADTASIDITDNDSGQWALTGPSQVDEAGTATYTISLAGTLQAGETTAIELSITDIDTTSADYASFTTAIADAIAGRSELSFAGGVLTYTCLLYTSPSPRD